MNAFAPPDIPPIDAAAATVLRDRIDGLAKPRGALGRLEDLATRLAAIQARPDPRAERARAYVFAGDHGLNQEGVSAYPSAVTAAMVATYLAGKATVNAFAKACDVEVIVVDAGVDAEPFTHPALIDAKVRRGTRNAALEPAMTPDELATALSSGEAIADQASTDAVDILIPGEMGIGNTASAALLMHRLLPAPLEACIGRGAGHDDEGLARKIAAIGRAAGRVETAAPLDALREFGGFEIAMMAGLILGGAARRKTVLIDGFISSAAALVAIRLAPKAKDYCLFAHVSAESGHALLLNELGGEPLLDLGMRLGEGTGAILAVPLLRAATTLPREVASLDDVLSGRL